MKANPFFNFVAFYVFISMKYDFKRVKKQILAIDKKTDAIISNAYRIIDDGDIFQYEK